MIIAVTSMRRGHKKTIADGAMVTRCHPYSPSADGETRSGHGPVHLHHMGRGGATVLGLDNGARTVDAYLPSMGVRAETLGAIQSLLWAPGLQIPPAL